MYVIGMCFSRQFAFSVASGGVVSESHTADFLSLDPATAATAFVRWWEESEHEAAAIVWPENPPLRYSGLFRYLSTQPNVYSITPRAIKSQCGGPECTVSDVIKAARTRHHLGNPETYEQAVACIAAGMLSTSRNPN